MLRPSDDAEPSAGDPPPAADSRLAQPGSPYRPSGRLGSWWIATLPAIAIGAVAGLLGGGVIGSVVFTATRPSAQLKPMLIMLIVCVLAVAVVTAACTRIGRVRSPWFTFVVGLAGGVTFAVFGTCALVACGAGAGGPNGGFSSTVSTAWTYFSDWSAFDAALVTAVPSAATRGIIFCCAGAIGVAVGGATYLVHGIITEGNLYDEATGGWYRCPVEVAKLDPALRPRERWWLREWTPILDEADVASRNEWIVLRVHAPRNPGAVLAAGCEGEGEGEEGLPLVSLALVRSTGSRAFSVRHFRTVEKRKVETTDDGTPFFVSPDELNALLHGAPVVRGLGRAAP